MGHDARPKPIEEPDGAGWRLVTILPMMRTSESYLVLLWERIVPIPVQREPAGILGPTPPIFS